jgi:transposase-like protein
MSREERSACPRCGQKRRVVKEGLNNKGGNQRYRCLDCNRYFTPNPWLQGHDPSLKEQAVSLYLEGLSLRSIGRQLGVHHQSVANWVDAAEARLPEKVEDSTPTEVVEIDELFTHVGKKTSAST